jgi:hypothetical protein
MCHMAMCKFQFLSIGRIRQIEDPITTSSTLFQSIILEYLAAKAYLFVGVTEYRCLPAIEFLLYSSGVQNYKWHSIIQQQPFPNLIDTTEDRMIIVFTLIS